MPVSRSLEEGGVAQYVTRLHVKSRVLYQRPNHPDIAGPCRQKHINTGCRPVDRHGEDQKVYTAVPVAELHLQREMT